MVYDVMGAREAAWHCYGPYPAAAADPEFSSPQPGRPTRGAAAGPGTGALTALPRRVQVPSVNPLRAAQPEISLLQRVLRGLERL